MFVTNFSLPAAAGGSATVTRTGGGTSTADQTSYNFNAVNIGTNAADQMLILIPTGRSTSNNQDISSFTVDGVSPTAITAIALGNFENFITNVMRGYAIMRSSLPDPTQTDVDIAVTFGASCLRAACEVFVATGADITSFDTAVAGSSQEGGSSTTNLNCDTYAGGIGVGCVTTGDPADAWTWSGTEVTQQTSVQYENSRLRSAIISNGTAETNRAISAATTNSSQPTGVFMTFEPL